jgi:hypothetical protein
VIGPVINVNPYGTFEGNANFIIPYGIDNYQTVMARLSQLDPTPGIDRAIVV